MPQIYSRHGTPTLRSAVETVGIRYEHLPELGIASEERQKLKCQKDDDALFDRYEARDLPQQSGAVARISDWICEGGRVYQHVWQQSNAGNFGTEAA